MRVKKILFNNGKKYYWEKSDLHTHQGIVKECDIKNKTKAKSTTNKDFLILNANFSDKIEKIKRGPAIVSKKDLGLVLTNTGINKNSTVLDAGTGCAFSALLFSQFCRKVYSYEKSRDFYNLARKNIMLLGVKNIVLKNKNINERIDEKDLDLIFLDLPEPWLALENCYESLKQGSFLVTYLPTIYQTSNLVREAKRHNFFYVRTVELIERDWHIEERKVRPVSKIIAHTAFLTFLRKA